MPTSSFFPHVRRRVAGQNLRCPTQRPKIQQARNLFWTESLTDRHCCTASYGNGVPGAPEHNGPVWAGRSHVYRAATHPLIDVGLGNRVLADALYRIVLRTELCNGWTARKFTSTDKQRNCKSKLRECRMMTPADDVPPLRGEHVVVQGRARLVGDGPGLLPENTVHQRFPIPRLYHHYLVGTMGNRVLADALYRIVLRTELCNGWTARKFTSTDKQRNCKSKLRERRMMTPADDVPPLRGEHVVVQGRARLVGDGPGLLTENNVHQRFPIPRLYHHYLVGTMART